MKGSRYDRVAKDEPDLRFDDASSGTCAHCRPANTSRRLSECVVVAPPSGPEIIAGGDECSRRTLPASTFKIPHALVGLETKVITSETVMKWDGAKKDFPAWERDHTLDSAIKSSVVWFFQRMATLIGRDRELEYLRKFGYGSADFKRDLTMFWLNGDLTISPLEQVAFLHRLFAYDLPVERRHIDTVKAAITMPPGKLSNAQGIRDFAPAWPAGTIVRAKTGSGTVNGERVTWLVGALENGGKRYLFASRVRAAASVEATAAPDLALRILNAVAPGREQL